MPTEPTTDLAFAGGHLYAYSYFWDKERGDGSKKSAAATPLPAATDYAWSANASDPDNILTNEVHFTPALADIAHTNAIKLTAASDMTVRMPAGSDWSAPFGLKFYANSGRALTLDFANATLSQPDTFWKEPTYVPLVVIVVSPSGLFHT